jgi:hypothetical protein
MENTSKHLTRFRLILIYLTLNPNIPKYEARICIIGIMYINYQYPKYEARICIIGIMFISYQNIIVCGDGILIQLFTFWTLVIAYSVGPNR